MYDCMKNKCFFLHVVFTSNYFIAVTVTADKIVINKWKPQQYIKIWQAQKYKLVIDIQNKLNLKKSKTVNRISVKNSVIPLNSKVNNLSDYKISLCSAFISFNCYCVIFLTL